MATASGPPPTAPAPTSPGASWFPFNIPNFGDRVFRAICLSAGVVVIGLFLLLGIVLVVRSWLTLTTLGVDFFTSDAWNPVEEMQEFGALAFVFGTVATSVIAMLIAVPLGVGTAAFLSEIAPGWLRRIVSFLVEMLAAIPSVVYGFWGMFIFAPKFMQPVLTWLGGPNTGGKGILAAGIVLAIMIVPYVTAVSYDVCRAVPKSQREAALALGATRWQMIRSAVLPYARPGIVGACFLALGRALGETMAVTMLIGNKAAIEWSPFALGDSIASILANQYKEASYDTYISALTELALVLLLVSVATSALARLLIWRVASGRSVKPAPRHGFWGGLARALHLVRLTLGLLLPLLIVSYITQGILAGVLREPRFLPLKAVYAFWDQFLTEGPAAVVGNTAALAVLYVAAFFLFRTLLRLVVQSATTFAKIVNYLMTGVLTLSSLITVVPLFLILGYLIYMGVEALNWDFFTQLPAPVGETGGGMANALYGSALLVGLATLFAVPVGLLAAIYLAENRNSFIGSVIRFIGELLSGVPSIVIGLFVYAVVVRPMGHFSGWAGAFALGIMMIPIVMRASEESLKLVPESIRHASYALGASQWQTVLRVIVPAALPAIITGVFLAIARIAGETAPLLLTAGWNAYFPTSPNDFTPSVPYFIYNYAVSPYKDWHRQAWAAALVLLVLVLLLNFGIRFLTGKRVILASRAD